MVIPDFITNDIPSNPLENNYFRHADAAWERLFLVATKKLEYIPDDLSALVNTLERYYKGFLKTMALYTSYSLPVVKHHENDEEYFLKRDHYIKGLVKEIESNFTNLSPCTVNQKVELDKFLVALQWKYTNARYSTEPSFQDFLKVYQFATKQKEVLYSYLDEKILQKSEDRLSEFDVNL